MEKKLGSMKSHDWHKLMQQLMPLGLRGLMQPHVQLVFNSICVKVWDPKEFQALRDDVATTFSVATPLWPSVGVKPNTWKSWRFGVLRDSRMFRARLQGPKHLAFGVFLVSLERS